MDVVAYLITVGILMIFIIAAYAKLDATIRAEHKKTRKETQEIKTRLTNARQSRERIEKTLKKKK